MSKAYLHFWHEHSHRNLWQHPLWFEFQKSIGRKAWLFEEGKASALIIKHNLPFGLSWLEVPRGPLFGDDKSLKEILSVIKKKARHEKAIFIRLSSYSKIMIHDSKIMNASADHHPEDSLVIDLKQEEADILKQMKPKGRYNIKVARKHEVRVEPAVDVEDFYNLLKKTSNRDGFNIHSKSYYENMLDVFGDNIQLLIATYQDEVIAGGFFVYLDDWGIYYYGASDNKHRNLMAPYLLQWEAILEAKERGCKYYDFLGIAPENTKNHPWKGVTDFKKKFGGEVVHYPKAKEIVLRPLWYWIYKIYKRLKG